MGLYLLQNAPMQTVAAPVPVTTGTAIKTMLQFKASATIIAKIVEWGISFSGFAAAAPIKVELIETDVAATVTAMAAGDITKVDAAAIAGGDPTTNLIPVGATSTGYTATAEGSIAAVRNLDAPQQVPPNGFLIKQFPLGREPAVQISKFARIRVTAAAAVDAYCYMVLEI